MNVPSSVRMANLANLRFNLSKIDSFSNRSLRAISSKLSMSTSIKLSLFDTEPSRPIVRHEAMLMLHAEAECGRFETLEYEDDERAWLCRLWVVVGVILVVMVEVGGDGSSGDCGGIAVVVVLVLVVLVVVDL